jgi:hypothetical protein
LQFPTSVEIIWIDRLGYVFVRLFQWTKADRVVVFTQDGLFHILDADQIASVSVL